MRHLGRTPPELTLSAALLLAGPALAQGVSPLGLTSAINTPVAQVLPQGTAVVGWSNNNPEIAPPAQGAFGSLGAGLGLLPGLEAFARLSYSGDLQCSMFTPDCAANRRDLSVSAKYQLPLALPYNTRLALGSTDFGGAATHYRSHYIVATTPHGPWHFSWGYARKDSPQALLDGPFGSLMLRVSEPLSLQLEHDSQSPRIGGRYIRPLGTSTELVASLSHSGSRAGGQLGTQVGLQLVMHLGQRQSRLLQQHIAVPPATVPPAAPVAPIAPPQALQASPGQAPESAPDLGKLIQQLQRAGFSQVQVTPHANGLLHIQAEPAAWRQSKLQALGIALQTTLAQAAPESRRPWLITLTHLGQPVVSAYTNAHCAAQFKAGHDHCDTPQTVPQPAVQFFSHPAIPEHLLESAKTSAAPTLVRPQFEWGLGLRTAIGTEYGLADYSAAAQLSAELPLSTGLAAQATASTPLSHSDSYGPGQVFADQRHTRTQAEQTLLSYWRPHGPWGVQASLGYINATDRGGQLDATWHNADGRWRASGHLGRYTNTHGLYRLDRQSALVSLRYSVMPAVWQIEATAGQFYHLDQGWLLASNHWMGDTRFRLYLRRSGMPSNPLMPVRSFAGIEVSLPLGASQAKSFAGMHLRGSDRWQHRIETKVGERDNLLTPGYGQVPQPKHGLMTDGIDYDRSGQADLWADRKRARLAMHTPLP